MKLTFSMSLGRLARRRLEKPIFGSHVVGVRPNGSLASEGWFNGLTNPLPPVPEGNDFVAISANTYHSAALRADGSIAAWGLIKNQDFQYIEPTAPEGKDFVALSAGEGFGVALRANGSLVAWGTDSWEGRLNVPSGSDFVAVQTYGSGGVAMRANGSLAFWGGVALENQPPAGNDFITLGTYGNSHPMLLIKAVPVAVAGPDQTVDCTSANGATVTLDGSASYDPDGRDDLDYEWSVAEDSGVTLDHPHQAVTTGTFPGGVHQVTLTVNDVDEFGVRKGGVGVTSVTITVVDDEPPVALVTTCLASLWPANGAMIPVTVSVQASDTCTDPDDLAIYCTVSSSQADVTKGSGKWTGDVNGHDGYTAPVNIALQSVGGGVYSATISLRAERDSWANAGRIYSVNLTVVDGAGNLGNATTTVVVPHDGKKK